jgi:hypothetical protein
MILDAYGDSGICRQNGKIRAKTGQKWPNKYAKCDLLGQIA